MIFSCDHCKKEFNARPADRKRGWARFCSKSCKATSQEKRTGQFAAYLSRDVSSSGSGYETFEECLKF